MSDAIHPAVRAAELLLEIALVGDAHTGGLTAAMQRTDLAPADACRFASSVGIRLRHLAQEGVSQQARFLLAIDDDAGLERLFGQIPDVGAAALQLIREARDQVLRP